jgi:hypothetical protein
MMNRGKLVMGVTLAAALALTGCAGKVSLASSKSCQAHGGTYNAAEHACTLGGGVKKQAVQICQEQGGFYDTAADSCVLEGG